MQISYAIFTSVKNVGRWGPNYFVPHLPPDSIIIIGPDLVLTSCNTTHFFRLFEESKQYVAAPCIIVFLS